jgi:hypothetical protein
VVLEGLDEPSYSRRTVLRLCFDYNDDLYGGANVCHETIPATLGGLGSCSIQVDWTGRLFCELCEFCNGRDDNYQLLSAFDCANVGGEESRVCTSDYANNTDSILRFLANPQLSTACERAGTPSAAAHMAGLLIPVWMAMVLPFAYYIV